MFDNLFFTINEKGGNSMLKIDEYKPLNIKECPLIKKGKVRDLYKIDNNRILMVASDRISAFDYILPNPIPKKGIILSKISGFWFDYFKNTIENHIVNMDFDTFPDFLKPYKSILWGRSIIVRKVNVFPIECVVRGYLAGSGYKDYLQNGAVCGIKLPPGLQKGSKLPDPIFTPATKAEEGHDENITEKQAVNIVGRDNFNYLRESSIKIYEQAREFALNRGIIIADTKFEFGWIDDKIILIDEILTPDSSRFWPVQDYIVGKEQKSFDKQFVRDYLESINWDKNPPVPELPDYIIKQTACKYMEAYTRLTGKTDIPSE